MSRQLAQAWIAYEQRRYELAEEYAGRVLCEEPENSEATAIVALCCSLTGRHAEANETAERAVTLEPDDAYVHFVRALVIFNDEHWEGRKGHRVAAMTGRGTGKRMDIAMEAVEESLRLDPYEARVHLLKARILCVKERRRKALEVIGTTLELDPEMLEARVLRAELVRWMGDRDEAMSLSEEALKLGPDDADAHETHGWAFLQKGEAKKACYHFRECLRIDPTNESARNGMHHAYHSMNSIFAFFTRLNMRLETLTKRARLLLGAAFLLSLGILILASWYFSISPSWILAAFVLVPLAGTIVYAFTSGDQSKKPSARE